VLPITHQVDRLGLVSEKAFYTCRPQRCIEGWWQRSTQARVAGAAGGQALDMLELVPVKRLAAQKAQKSGWVHRHQLADRDNPMLGTQLVKLSLEHIPLCGPASNSTLQVGSHFRQ